MSKWLTKKYLTSLFTVTFLVGVSFWIVSIPTDSLLAFIGTDNAYLFMYLVAFVGSITTFASIPYPLILLGLASGGMNPVLLGLSSAFGVMTADSLTFVAAKKGRVLLGPKLQKSFLVASEYVKRYPRLLTPGLLLYGTFSPLSNDFAVISLSLMKYKYFRVIPPLAVGNIIYNVGIAFIGVYAYDWIAGLL